MQVLTRSPARVATLLLAPLLVHGALSVSLGQTRTTLIGCFENVQTSGEHASGYSVRLWSSGAKWFGVLDRFAGAAFDPPMGLLEAVQHNASTGDISFKARMSFGWASPGSTRELVAFEGVLGKDGVRGIFEIEHLDAPQAWRLERESAVLVRSERLCDHRAYADREQWWSFYEPILRARGPHW